MPYAFPTYVAEGQAISYVAKEKQTSCHSIFLAAAGAATRQKLPADERLLIYEFARSACLTQNPDVLWQIAYVESGFKMKIVNIGGKRVLMGKEAENYLTKGLPANANVDIGPLQINWRANGSRSGLKPLDFLKGDVSINYLRKNLLKTFVNSCGFNWLACYHSFHPERGQSYKEKAIQAGHKLKEILSRYL